MANAFIIGPFVQFSFSPSCEVVGYEIAPTPNVNGGYPPHKLEKTDIDVVSTNWLKGECERPPGYTRKHVLVVGTKLYIPESPAVPIDGRDKRGHQLAFPYLECVAR